MNDEENEEKVFSISTKFIRKLTDLFFLIIGEKASTNIPLNKTYYLRKMARLTCLYVPIYLPMDDYLPYSYKQSDIFEANINKEFRCIHGYTNHDEHNVLITWVSINSGEMLLSEFPQALDINPCPRTIVCNTCELIHIPGGIFNADETFVVKYECGFTGSFFYAPVIIYDSTKMQFMKMQRTPKENIDEQILNNPINENIDETKRLTSGIEILKLRKTGSHIYIENFNKVSYEKDHIDKVDRLDKKVANVKEGLTGNLLLLCRPL